MEGPSQIRANNASLTRFFPLSSCSFVSTHADRISATDDGPRREDFQIFTFSSRTLSKDISYPKKRLDYTFKSVRLFYID